METKVKFYNIYLYKFYQAFLISPVWLKCSEEKEREDGERAENKGPGKSTRKKNACSGKTICHIQQHNLERDTHSNYLKSLASDSSLVISYLINLLCF